MFLKKLLQFLTKRYIISTVAVLIVGGLVYYYGFGKKSALNLITVTRGDITEEVIITGNTKPVQTIDLAFQSGGKIARVGADVGDTVFAGQVIVELDSSELSAQLRQAQANVQAAQARLDALKRGTRPEDVQISRTKLNQAQQDLDNDYNGVLATLNDAYSKADDAVRNQLSTFFTNADGSSPLLAFAPSATDPQSQSDAQSQRFIAGTELNAWKSELTVLSMSASNNMKSALGEAIQKAKLHLAVVAAFLNRTADTLVAAPVSMVALTTYKTNLTSAKSEVNTAITNVNSIAESIASQTLIVRQYSEQLNLQLAGSAEEDIRAQEAAVAGASASVDLINAQLAKTVIRSPINGTVVRQDAKAGQIAPANSQLVSVISLGSLEIESNVPEVDIGKIIVGNAVIIALDAFSGEMFFGKVAKIDPAETIIDGVVNFKVTVSLDKADTRLRSGLTANLQIETKKKSGVLILPGIAILQNDSGVFVQKYSGGATNQVPVTLGVRDENGNVEILSGVAEGDTVLNIGLKAQ